MAQKKTITDGRPSRHDDLVAELLGNVPQVVNQCDWDRENESLVVVERPCGKGFIDLCITWKLGRCGHSPATGWLTITRGIIVEVKSELEQWSAGDVIRQLKGYQKSLDECMSIDCNACRIEPLKPRRSSMAMFSGRELSVSERLLFQHEHVRVIEPRWRKQEQAAE